MIFVVVVVAVVVVITVVIVIIVVIVRGDDAWGHKQAWDQRGWKRDDAHKHWGPRFDIAVVRLVHTSGGSCREAREWLRDAADVIAPDLDLETMAFPSGEQVRLNMIKLDCVCMLWEREWARNCKSRVCRNVNPDSGPQKGWDFFAVIEERFIWDVPGWDPLAIPLGGFTWIRRRLPSTIVARGQGSTAQKTMKMVHAVVLEIGEDGLWPWRCSVKNFLSDQA